MHVELLYIPDAWLLRPSCWEAYLHFLALDSLTEESLPERLARLILEDIASELVPHWVRVTVESPRVFPVSASPASLVRHVAVAEEGRPRGRVPESPIF
jgi:hypothetical protein